MKYTERGLRNSELIALAEKEERILLTHDHDFLRIELYKSKYGVIVLDIHPPSIKKMKEILEKFFRKFFF